MRAPTSMFVVVAVVTALTLARDVTVEGVEVNIEYDKAFDFEAVRTWGWNPEGAGYVRMARTREDDPEAMQRRAEPPILDAVDMEMARRSLQKVASQPDVTLTYVLLLSTNMTAQTMGQFLPATTAWGYVPFAPATQSMKMMNQGALVLDLSAKGVVVWRGVAQARVAFGADDKKREAILREGVRDLLRRFPPR
jgi:hypothetical protein